MADEIPPLLALNQDEPLIQSYDPNSDVPLPGDPSQSMDPETIIGPNIPESMVVPSMRSGSEPAPILPEEEGHRYWDKETGKSMPIGEARRLGLIDKPAAGPGAPPSMLGERRPYQAATDPSIPQTLNVRGMFGDAPGINLREAQKAAREMEGYEGRLSDSELKIGGLTAEKTALIQQKSTAEQAFDKEQVRIREKAIKAQKEADDLRLQAMETAKADVRSKISGLQDLQDNLLSSKMDPGRFWNDRTTGQKIAIAIGIALSSFGSIMSGGKQPNYALDIIDKAIDRDLDAQKADIDRLGMKINVQQNLIAQTRAVTQDAQAEYSAAKAMAFDQVSAQLDVAALRYKDATAKSRLGLLGNDVATKAEDFRMKTLDHLSSAAARRGGIQLQIATADYEAKKGTWAMEMTALSKMGTPGTMPGQHPDLQWLPGSQGPAKKENAARAAMEWEDGKLLDAAFSNLIALGRASKETMNPVEYAKLKTLAESAASQIQLYVQKVNKLGVPSVFDYKMIESIAPDPTKWNFKTFAGLSIGVLKQSRRMLRNKVLANVRGNILEPKPGSGFPELSPEEEE